jgi:hypothetical protein
MMFPWRTLVFASGKRRIRKTNTAKTGPGRNFYSRPTTALRRMSHRFSPHARFRSRESNGFRKLLVGNGAGAADKWAGADHHSGYHLCRLNNNQTVF